MFCKQISMRYDKFSLRDMCAASFANKTYYRIYVRYRLQTKLITGYVCNVLQTKLVLHDLQTKLITGYVCNVGCKQNLLQDMCAM